MNAKPQATNHLFSPPRRPGRRAWPSFARTPPAQAGRAPALRSSAAANPDTRGSGWPNSRRSQRFPPGPGGRGGVEPRSTPPTFSACPGAGVARKDINT